MAQDESQRASIPFVHPTADVESGAGVGIGTKIWHFCHVLRGASIGRNCTLGQNVYVGATAVIGDGCKIQNNVSIYDSVILEDDVFVGPSAVFTNVKEPRAAVEQKDNYQPTIVRKGATIGANATIVCGIEIGEGAMIGAGAVVTKNVPPGETWVGVPAMDIKIDKRPY